MVHTASLLARSVKGGGGGGVIFRVRSPNDSNAASSGVGVGGSDAEDESHILGDATVAGTFSHFLIFFPGSLQLCVWTGCCMIPTAVLRG